MKKFLLPLIMIFAFFVGCRSQEPVSSPATVLPSSPTPTSSPTPNATQQYQATLQANQTQNALYNVTQSEIKTEIAQTQAAKELTPTETPTPTATSSPTPTATPFPTVPDPTSREVIFPLLVTSGGAGMWPPNPIPTPAKPAESYRLKNWTEQEALHLIYWADQFAYDTDSWGAGSERPYIQPAQDPILVAVQEALRAFPNSPYSTALKWKEALANAIKSNSESDEWVLNELEQGLNDGRYTMDELEETLNRYGFTIRYSQSDPNLFGRGREGTVLLMGTFQDYSDGLFIGITQNSQGTYQVELIHNGWSFFDLMYSSPDWYDQKTAWISDHTKDGVPEIILEAVDPEFGGNSTTVFIYQWDGNHFKDLSNGGFYLSRETGWHYEANSTEDTLVFTRVGIDGDPLAYYYQSHSKSYQLIDIEYMAPPEIGDGTDFWMINFLIEDGEYKIATDTLEQASLSKPLKYFLRFQLGFLYALQAQPEQAISTLQTLEDDSAISDAAQAFLEQYQDAQDIYRACQAAQTWMETLIPPENGKGEFYWPENSESIWGYEIRQRYQNGALYIGELCNLRAALRAVTNTIRGNDPVTTLQQAGVNILAALPLDADGDGDQDWIIRIDAPMNDDLFPWVLLNQGGKWVARRLPNGAYQYNGNAPIENVFKAQVLPIPGQRPPLVLLQMDQLVFTFYFEPIPSGFVLLHYASTALNNVLSFTVPDSTQPEFRVDFVPDSFTPDWQVYRWEPTESQITVVEESLSAAQLYACGPTSLAHRAEAKLLEEENLREAIPLLEAVAAAFPGTGEDCYNGYDHARLAYLLGLAYEWYGYTEKAVQAYWTTWHDYPDSAYALMARAKLELAP